MLLLKKKNSKPILAATLPPLFFPRDTWAINYFNQEQNNYPRIEFTIVLCAPIVPVG